MRCDDVHEALSARLDGEAATQPDALIDAHLAGCAACRAWLVRAEGVTQDKALPCAANSKTYRNHQQ